MIIILKKCLVFLTQAIRLPELGVFVLNLPLLTLVGVALVWFVQSWWFGFADLGLSYIVWDALLNSMLLLFGVVTISVGVGVTLAWLMSQYEFAGKRIFDWLLLAPLAVPSFVAAHAWVDLFGYSGLLPTTLRNLAGIERTPDIRGLVGASLILGFALYPYVYSLMRVAFEQVAQRNAGLRAASSSLGANAFESFWRVSLPSAWPSLSIGMTLVAMESLADYGAVAYLGVETFTVGIYKTWFASDQRAAAFALVCSMLLLVGGLIAVQRFMQGNLIRFRQVRSSPTVSLPVLRGKSRVFAWGLCCFAVVLGFVLPLGRLIWVLLTDAETHLNAWQWQRVTYAIWHSVQLSTYGAVSVVLLSCILIVLRWTGQTGLALRFGIALARLGYAVPGAAIAMALLWPIASFDHMLSEALSYLTGKQIGLLITGSMVALMYAYTLRFFAVAYGGLEQGIERLSPSSYHAALSLGASRWQAVKAVLWPAMRTSVFAAFVLVWIDCLKELPATLMLRPFNFDTLPVLTYQWVADERAAQAAIPSLLLVLVGLVPVWVVKKILVRR